MTFASGSTTHSISIGECELNEIIVKIIKKILKHCSVSKDFRILFEIVPNNLGGSALRGHVSIDNLQMRNCFADSPRKDSCSTSQIKCNDSRIPVCIENARICDLVDDCDESEDELLNCGEFLDFAISITN